MRTTSHARSFLVFALGAAVLGGCSAGRNVNSPGALPLNGALAAPAQRPMRVPFWIAALPDLLARRRTAGIDSLPGDAQRLPAAARTLAVCALSADACTIFSRPGYRPSRTITNGLNTPGGAVAGINNRLYVANGGGANVQIYARNGSHPVQTLNDPGQTPIDVAVAKQTTIVSNVGSGSGGANVAVYLGSATSPNYQLTDSAALQGIGVAVDAHGDCFWSVNTSAGGAIDQFPGCKRSGHPLRLLVTLGFAGGLAFDGGNNLWYADQSAGVYRCTGVSSCTLVVAVAPSCSPGVTLCDPVMLNFDRGFNTLFVADADYGVYSIRSFAPGSWPDYVVTPVLQAPGMPIGVAPDPAPTLPPR